MMAEKPNPLYNLLKTQVPINISSELKEKFYSVNKARTDACKLSLKQSIQGRKLASVRDASFRSAGYAPMIESNPDQEIQSKRKTFAFVAFAFGSKFFAPAQRKISRDSKTILIIYMTFLESAHNLWGATRPTIVLTDNKFVTCLFQTKAIPLALCDACDYVLQFNFKIAHIVSSVKTATDFLSKLELKVAEKILLKIREDTQTTCIEINTFSSDVTDEEQFFFTQANSEDESEEQTLERKEQPRENAKQYVANEEQPSLKIIFKNLQRSTETPRHLP